MNFAVFKEDCAFSRDHAERMRLHSGNRICVMGF